MMEGFDEWARVQLGRNGPQFSFLLVLVNLEATAFVVDHDIGGTVTRFADNVVGFLAAHVRQCLPKARLCKLEYLSADHMWCELKVQNEQFAGYQYISSTCTMVPAQALELRRWSLLEASAFRKRAYNA